MKKKRKEIKRGPKGGKKHQPGRGHVRKSRPARTKRFKDQAIRTLRQSKKLCEKHGVPFDGADMLEEYLTEKKRLGRKTVSAARKRKPA